MLTYIINLASATDRRCRISVILESYSILDIQFVEAIDGRKLSAEQITEMFDIPRFEKEKCIVPLPGEIGCTASHHRCYDMLLQSSEPYCLILEDDINPPSSHFIENIEGIQKALNTSQPRIILLSDWYWYTTRCEKLASIDLVNVPFAFLTHAYCINRAAAELLANEKPHYLADDWRTIKSKGIQLLACRPHLIEQEWSGGLATSIQGNKHTTTSLYIHIKRLGFLPFRVYLRILKALGLMCRPHINKPK